MKIDLSEVDNVKVLDRICEVYGFTQKIQLANHFDIAASSLSNRYRRGPLSYDFAVYCALDTGASISWLMTGEGPKFSGEPIQNLTPDTLAVPFYTLLDGEIHNTSTFPVSPMLFGKPLTDPMCITLDNQTYFIERSAQLSDGLWLIDVDGAVSIRELTVLPGKRLHVAGGNVPFECSVEDITKVGKVIGKYSEVN